MKVNDSDSDYCNFSNFILLFNFLQVDNMISTNKY